MVNTKATYEVALSLLTNPTPIDGGIALVLVDNALEALLKLLVDKKAKSPKEKARVYLMDLINCLSPDVEFLEGQKLSLLRLHNARNAFQHDGIIPNLDSVLHEYIPLAEDTLGVVSKELGLPWEEVSLSLLIRDQKTKGLFEKAEKAFEKKDYLTATAYSVYTFEHVKDDSRNRISGSGIAFSRFSVTYGATSQAVITYLTKLDEEIETFKLGLDYMDLRNYLDMARLVGIDSILCQFPTREKEEVTINTYREKLKNELKNNILTQDSLRNWYVKMRIPILKFALRTERAWRLSTEMLNEAVRHALEE
ncbi:hypothetical protein MUP01_09120 [Candidatus Bathyarchaeota archaeon]|nr:hypothetical protein [Candidatus Bathyarchaeota archaeon]